MQILEKPVICNGNVQTSQKCNFGDTPISRITEEQSFTTNYEYRLKGVQHLYNERKKLHPLLRSSNQTHLPWHLLSAWRNFCYCSWCLRKTIIVENNLCYCYKPVKERRRERRAAPSMIHTTVIMIWLPPINFSRNMKKGFSNYEEIKIVVTAQTQNFFRRIGALAGTVVKVCWAPRGAYILLKKKK